MDSHRFDRWTRSLATGASRRRLLKGIAGGVAAGAGGLLRRQGSAAADKVFICHNTGSETNPQVLIEVSVNAIPAHEAHDDLIGVDVSSDPFNCGDCGIVCEDNNACTDNLCVEGECVFPAIACDDQSACTDDSCDPATGCVFTPVNCDDGDACTVDGCEPATGCTHTPLDCNDGNACTNDRCDSATGCVHDPVNCDDGDPCTEDGCDPDTGCVNEQIICPVGQACLDGVCQGCLGTDCAGIVFGCDDDPGCNCFITVENTGFCHRNQPCAGLQSCTSSADCPPDHACSLSTCCGPEQGRICIRPCEGTGANFAAPSVAEPSSERTTAGR